MPKEGKTRKRGKIEATWDESKLLMSLQGTMPLGFFFPFQVR